MSSGDVVAVQDTNLADRGPTALMHHWQPATFHRRFARVEQEHKRAKAKVETFVSGIKASIFRLTLSFTNLTLECMI